ncbi:MAG: choice-of-anchor D domain-containing protein [Rhodothermaceae bacterium]|nr:choice-of-anchor D domain-containing protein [Rhodothermaceae bacterium]
MSSRKKTQIPSVKFIPSLLLILTLLSLAVSPVYAQVGEVTAPKVDDNLLVKPWEQQIVFKSQAGQNAIAFNPSGLDGEDLVLPTSLAFGPDGRLYVAQQLGTIYAYTIVQNGPQDFEVTDTEAIFEVKVNIDNHDDDGELNNGVVAQNGFDLDLDLNRQITGILVTGTPSDPILYVTSSDPRHGAGEINGIDDSGLDTNSGVISRLWKEAGVWQKLDLVRGLPRSEENHSINGLELDETNNILYVAVGGLTNAGSPSNNFARITEYALSAAILKVDLTVIDNLPVQGSGNTAWVYDMPTLDDPTRDNVNGITDPNDPGYDGIDFNDPFGGNNGLNQSKIVAGGPVQLHATGFRNPYDLVIMETPGYEGKMYSIDNGANQGWGGVPVGEGTFPGGTSGQCTNDYDPSEPGSNGPSANDGQVNNLNGLHYIRETEPGFPYYAGHPTPVRGNPEGAGLYTYFDGAGVFRTSTSGPNPLPADWPPIPAGTTSESECDFRNSGVKDGSLVDYVPSTNGMAEYTATTFDGDLQGAIISAGFSGEIYVAKLNEAGDQVINAPGTDGVEVLLSNFGLVPLDVIAQGDDDPFPGTIWAVTYGEENITIFEPSEVDCTGGPGPQDDDGDGYSNDDEIANGTGECNAGDKPSDNDGDLVSDLLDSNDDDDGAEDVDDPFAIDPDNGLGTELPVRYDLFQEDPGTGFFGVGFTGLMTNGSTNYLDQFDPGTLIAGGTAGLFTVPAVTEGDALGSTNTQDNGFQFGVDVSASTTPFEITVRIQPPFFNGDTPQDGQSQGFYIGTGDQDNYLKVAIAANGGNGGIEIVQEDGGTASSTMYANNLSGSQLIPDDVLNAETSLNLFLQVDPAAGTVLPGYGVDTEDNVYLGDPISMSGTLLSALQSSAQAVAVGIIATSAGPGPEFTATWDRVDIEAQENTASAYISFATPEDINASTASGSSFQIENTSINGQLIESVSFDLSTSLLPDMVFDPDGTAGDNTASAFSDDLGSESTGFVTHTLGEPHNGLNGEDGYDVVTVSFNDFDPGETFGFSIDVDPNNIKGSSAPGPNESGSVSGLELAGATVTVNFDDGSFVVAEPFRTENSVSAAEGNAAEGLPAKPGLAVVGVPGLKARVDELNQTVRVSGSPNQDVRLVVVEAALFVPQSGGYNVEAFDANTIIGIQEFSGTVGASGFVDFPVTITDTQEEAGLNYMAAVAEDGDGNTSLVSDIIVLDYNPNAVATVVSRINAGGPSITSNGIEWAADEFFSGGGTFQNSGIEIDNTNDDLLYYTERFDQDQAGLEYNIPVPGDGNYNVSIHLAEIFFGARGGGLEFGGPNQRVFTLNIEGGQVETESLDLYDQYGPATAVVLSYEDISVSDGALTISVLSEVREGKISAIEVSTFGEPSPITTAPNPLNFSVAEVGGSSWERNVAVTNSGSETLSITGVSFSGTNSDEFSSSFSGSVDVAGGASVNIPVVFAPTSDGAKSAQLEVAFNGTGSPSKTTLTGEGLVVSPGDVLYRVNAGGRSLASLNGFRIWTEDQAEVAENALALAQVGAPSPYVNVAMSGNNTFGTLDTITLDASVPSGVPPEVFQTERWDQVGDPNQIWSFPVEVGKEVTVNIYLSEIFLTDENNGTDGPRIFDIAVDGVVPAAFNDIDIFAEVGHDVGVMKTINTTSDGAIDIEFIQDGGQNLPAVKGIEILDPTLTSVEDDPTNLPESFKILGNYPNPFNPTTNIVFELPQAAEVSVEVYDVMGRKVFETQPNPFAPGQQQVTIEANDFASGIYLYRVIAQLNNNIEVQVGRMTFVK